MTTAEGQPTADVRLEDVVKRFDDTVAVDGISVDIPRGSFFALLGPSGCGKTTTLRMIGGFEEPTEGRIFLGDQDVVGLPPYKRDVNTVFQSYALFPHMTIEDNVAFGLERKGVPKDQLKGRVSEMLELVGLSGFAKRKPRQLSGGQQQRVALGRAIVAETKVCLMDEPLSNLDAQLRVEMRREIRALQRRLGMTMLYVTHDQVEAMTMADQVVLMRNGRIEQDAAPAALYEKPATIFAARFVGTPPMNVIPATLVPAELASPPRPRDTLAIGIRPEAVRIGASGMPATVVAVEYLGADTLIDTRVADQSFIVRVGGRASVTVGDNVHLAWDATAAHWFDLSSQCRIDH